MERQNITLSINKEILQKVKIIAVKQSTSVSALLTRLLEDFISREEGYQAASQNHLRLLQQEFDLGTNGSTNWSRDELHAR
jgi:predicted transcriptional regulator